MMRAIFLEAEPIDADSWRVSGGARDHRVEVEGGRVWCNCFDGQIRDGHSCKHSLLLRLLGWDPKVGVALRQLVPKGKTLCKKG